MKKLIGISMLLIAQSVFADANLDSAIMFHELFMQCLSSTQAANKNAEYLHYLPDENILKANDATSIEEAMARVKTTSVDTLNAANRKLPMFHKDLKIDQALAKTPITIVIVPGIFGEFIRVRPFEDIFARHSKFRDVYDNWVDLATKNKTTLLEKPESPETLVGTDLSYSTTTLKDEPVSLKTLVQVGSIDDANGDPLAKIVFLFPQKASLETLGDLKDRAKMLNRRLEKYLAITGPQNLVFVGYSRGTTFALEMLAQAKKENASWLGSVKGMIGLSGVVWGSTSADQTANPNEPMYQTVQDTHALIDSLQPIDANLRFYQRWELEAKNAWNIATFVGNQNKRSLASAPGLDLTQVKGNMDNPLLAAMLKMDFAGPTILLFKEIYEMVHDNPDASSIQRVKNLVNAALLGADQLRTEERMDWWKHTDLPASLTYYSLTAIMPNPADTDLSKRVAASDLAFAKGSFEDQFLLKGRNDYLKASGIAANDSQVAIPQAMFLPNLIHAVNPSLPQLNTQFLGTIGTHHWGAALEIVFDMKDGVNNPYPREALLKAMAAKVALDLQAEHQLNESKH